MSNPFQPDTEGIWYGLDSDVYRKAPGVNQSSLKAMERSPAHYQAELTRERKPTPAQVFGTILHAAVLEPHKEPQFVVRPEGMTFTTKEGKAWKEVQTLPILTAEEAAAVNSCRESVLAHPYAAAILEKAQTEVSVFKRHEASGLLLKGRLDCILTDDGNQTIVADVKTCEDGSLAGFTGSAFKFGYHRQAAFYLDMVGASSFVFIAVEKEAPFAVNVLEFSATAVEYGRSIYERELATIAECTASGIWPSYPHEPQIMGLPEWMERRLSK